MGGFCSPGLTIIVCMMHEHAWSVRHALKRRDMVAVRDVNGMTVLLPTGHHTGFPTLANFLTSGTPDECELELEQPVGTSVNMLICSILIQGSQIMVVHRNKCCLPAQRWQAASQKVCGFHQLPPKCSQDRGDCRSFP